MAVIADDFGRVSKRFADVWEGVTWHALAVNVLLRLLIVAFTIDALINAGDDRFAGKALGPRNVGILLGLSMLFPLLHAVRGQWKRYPMWYDNLYLSVFALDMAGNSLNLYNTIESWDHVPHFHGPGALAVVMMGAFGVRAIAAAGLTTILHTALETQEYYGDVFLHTHNVKRNRRHGERRRVRPVRCNRLRLHLHAVAVPEGPPCATTTDAGLALRLSGTAAAR